MKVRAYLPKTEIKQLLSYNPTPVILEVGANDGSDSLDFLRTIPNCKLYCFEPDPRATFKFKCKINTDRCELTEAALSDVEGVVDFHLSDSSSNWDKSSSLKQPIKHLTYYPWCKFTKTIQVQCLTLDSWAVQNNIVDVDFVWADVQGAEKQLILGSKNTIQNIRYFYTEFSEIKDVYDGDLVFDELNEIMESNNFELVERFENDALFINKKFKQP